MLSLISLLSFASVTLPVAGQSFSSSAETPVLSFVQPEPGVQPESDGASIRPAYPATGPMASRPFSRLAFSAGVSPLGFGLQAVTNVNRRLNVRATGNVFSYSDYNISTEGFNVKAQLNFASAGVSADYYPFHLGWRISPGVLFYNGNEASATFQAQPGASFTLDNTTFYSASGANAVVGKGDFGFGNGNPAFTLTSGWGNEISAKGSHWSFPFEVGVAFIQAPTVSLVLSGEICDQYGQNCVDVATDPYAQQALAAQIQKYRNDLNPLKTYPIVSFGVAYSFRVRSSH